MDKPKEGGVKMMEETANAFLILCGWAVLFGVVAALTELTEWAMEKKKAARKTGAAQTKKARLL